MNEPDKRTMPAPYHDTPPAGSATPVSSGDQITQKRSEPTTLTTDLAPPDVPGYVLSRKLGEGGMGAVYLAHDPTFDRAVAVKVMHPRQSAARFVTESKVTAQLPHPGVPPVYALGETADGRPFLAMKLVEGRTLSEELPPAPDGADLPRLLGAFERVCETVGFAHSRGVVHRDLKPANVMVGGFGEVLVMDWGIAKAVCESQPAGEGTPAYMAPEQWQGGAADPRADVYALGGILTAVLTGRPSPAGLDVCPADPGLIAVAKRCLAAGASERYADGKDVAAAVAGYRAGVEERLRTAERERAAAEAKAAEQRKKRRVQALLAVALLVLLAGFAAFAWREDRQAERARTARAEFQIKEQQFEIEQTKARGEIRLREAVAATEAKQVAMNSIGLAARLREQYQFADADKALAQAEESAGKSGDPGLVAWVAEVRRDLAFVIRLDDIKNRKWYWITRPGGKGEFNTASAPSAYRKAFADRGLDLTVLDAEVTVARLSASLINAEVVAAIDDWALYEPDARLRDRLLLLAKKVGPDPWADGLRDASVWSDREAVRRLAVPVGPPRLPPGRVGVMAATLLVRSGWDELAITALSAARIAEPKDFELAFAYGRALETTKSDERIAAYEVARSLRPDNPAVWSNLGAAYADRKNYAMALVAYMRAIDLDPGFAPAHSNMAALWAGKEVYSIAAVSYNRAIELDPGSAAAHVGLGIVTESMGDRTGAIARYRKAIALDPGYVDAHYKLAGALDAERDIRGARAAYERVLQLDPKHFDANVKLVNFYYADKRYAEAIACARAAVRSDPKSADGHAKLGVVLAAAGDHDGAIAAYRTAVALDDRHGGAWLRLGAALCDRRGDLDGALAAYDKAAACDLSYALPHVYRGIVLSRKGDMAGAVAAYGRATDLDPRDAWTRNVLARLLATTPGGTAEQGKRAVEYATRACELTGWKEPAYIDTLAAAYARAGEFDKAVTFQKRALASTEFAAQNGVESRARLNLYEQKRPHDAPSVRPLPVAPPPRPVKP